MKLNVEFQEPDRKKKIKRIIAKEGLIVLGVLIIGLLFLVMGKTLTFRYMIVEDFFVRIGWAVIIFGYPIIHFILWAIKTLKEKE